MKNTNFHGKNGNFKSKCPVHIEIMNNSVEILTRNIDKKTIDFDKKLLFFTRKISFLKSSELEFLQYKSKSDK